MRWVLHNDFKSPVTAFLCSISWLPHSTGHMWGTEHGATLADVWHSEPCMMPPFWCVQVFLCENMAGGDHSNWSLIKTKPTKTSRNLVQLLEESAYICIQMMNNLSLIPKKSSIFLVLRCQDLDINSHAALHQFCPFIGCWQTMWLMLLHCGTQDGSVHIKMHPSIV